MDSSSGLAQVLRQLATPEAGLSIGQRLGMVNGLKEQFAAEFDYWPNFYDRPTTMRFVGVTAGQTHYVQGFVRPLRDKDRFASVGLLSEVPYREPEPPESDVKLKDTLLITRQGLWVHHKTAWNGEVEKTKEFRHTFEPLSNRDLTQLLVNNRLVEQVVAWFISTLKKSKERTEVRLKCLELGTSSLETVAAMLGQ